MDWCVDCGRNDGCDFLLAICGHVYCGLCKEKRWCGEGSRARCVVRDCPMPLNSRSFGYYKDDRTKHMESKLTEISKVYNRTRRDFPTLEDFNEYLNEKYEKVYKVSSNEGRATALSEIINQNRDTLERNSSKNSVEDEELIRQYIREEHKRVATRRLKREKLIDEYARGTLDGNLFNYEANLLEEQNRTSQKPFQYTVKGQKAVIGPSYQPTQFKTMTQVQDFPKPIRPSETLDSAEHATMERLKKMTEEELMYVS
eukprot:TRINITY_DN3365_c0_g1_i7.p1 TRINITY_DN3365_c0_g1~~TRINITY_DN3365_c0_g1_i7.p1  ORF type:complete len:257 (-),score=37.59 TRINITY_DN3365_c0_g1_i7:383-1153(-)